MTQLLWPGAAITMTQLLWLQPSSCLPLSKLPAEPGGLTEAHAPVGESAAERPLATSPSLQQRARVISEDNQAPPPEKWEQEVRGGFQAGTRGLVHPLLRHISEGGPSSAHRSAQAPRHPGTQAPEPANVAFCYSGMFPLCPSTLGLVFTTGGCSFQSGPHGEGFPKNRNLRDRPLHAPAPPSPARPTDLLSALPQSRLLPRLPPITHTHRTLVTVTHDFGPCLCAFASAVPSPASVPCPNTSHLVQTLFPLHGPLSESL